MTKVTILLIALAAGVGTWFGLKQYKSVRRSRVHVIGENVSRMSVLRRYIEDGAQFQSFVFAHAVGTGVVAEATSLPTQLLETFPVPVNADLTNYYLEDTWGRPFHVNLSHDSGRAPTNSSYFTVFIWSDGPNGRNEYGAGDDIPSGKREIVCPTP